MINHYQAKYYPYELSKNSTSDSPEKFGATLMDAKVELNPHQVEAAEIELDSYIVSNTSYLDVNWKDNLSIEEFNNNHVFFQKENASDYISNII